MAQRTFRINGQVTDAATKRGVPDLRIEAWNRDAAEHTVFGSSITDELGGFAIAASIDFPGGVVGPVPAVLKVFDGSKPVPATGLTAIPDLFSLDRPVTLQVQAPTHEPERVDRVTVPQFLSAIDFIRLSDFRGLYQEGRDRTTAAGHLMFDTLRTAMSQVELQPLRAPDVRNRDVIYQDTTTASERLRQQGVIVNEVKPYRKDTESLGTLTSLPANLNKGDKVVLYEENGIVKAYGVVRAPSTVDIGTVNQISADLKKVQTEADANAKQVDDLRAQLAQRDATIADLRGELVKVQKSFTDLSAQQIKPERIAALEETVRRLQPR